ncbi:PEP/pyruvate-binding domain-containing protein [Actinoplanes sp. NPDC051494]|uniref:PEP/pyruvate-binding domain-containing protein n=1 Tax=Actinoplanes sp. NPDC051494 TaxID=3363907 RepID=UPI00378B2101
MRLGLSVPAGFAISTAACRAFLRDGRFPAGFDQELDSAIARLATSRVSVRSGAAVSMPGMMDTILDVDVRGGITEAVAAVFASWNTPRAQTYRMLHAMPDDPGTAVVVQTMVYGDRDNCSGSGVAFSRDPATGEPVPYGEVAFGHRGDHVVSGTALTRPLADLAAWAPGVWAELTPALRMLERHYRDVCHVEFTVEAGRLWFLQVRPGGLVGRAAVRVAVDLADEGIISRAAAVGRITSEDVRLAQVRRIAGGADILVRGIGASPGVVTGRVATSAESAVRMAGQNATTNDTATRTTARKTATSDTPTHATARKTATSDTPTHATARKAATADTPTHATAGKAATSDTPPHATARKTATSDTPTHATAGKAATGDTPPRSFGQNAQTYDTGAIILVRPFTSPLDVRGLAVSAGVVTARGGPASHAAVVARAMGMPAVVSASGLRVDADSGRVLAGGRIVAEGTTITIDGTSGEVAVGFAHVVPDGGGPDLDRLLGWADLLRGPT